MFGPALHPAHQQADDSSGNHERQHSNAQRYQQVEDGNAEECGVGEQFDDSIIHGEPTSRWLKAGPQGGPWDYVVTCGLLAVSGLQRLGLFQMVLQRWQLVAGEGLQLRLVGGGGLFLEQFHGLFVRVDLVIDV